METSSQPDPEAAWLRLTGRASEARFRALIEHSHDGIVLFGADGTILYASPSTTKLLGWRPEELHQRRALEFVRADSQDAVREQLTEAVRRPGVPIPSQGHVRHQDGSWRLLEGTFTNLLHEPGIGAIVNNFRDLTGRKRAEQRQAAFAALGRRLNSATDAAAAARIIVGIADDLFGWDSCKLDLYDAQSDRCRSILTVDIVNGERQEVSPAYSDSPPSPRLRRSLDGLAELILREHPLALTSDRIPFGDVDRPSASLMSVPMREGGQVAGVLSIQSYRLHAYTNEDLAALQDLADHCAGALERIRGRTELERQRNELALILDTVPGIIFNKDRNHRLVRVNEAHARALGLPRSAIEGRTDAELGSPHVDRYIRDDEEVMRTGQPKLGIVEPMHAPAGTRWLQTDKLPYRDEHGNIIGILGFALDITARKEAEAALHRQHALLSAVVEGTSDAVFAKDLEGRYLIINTAGALALGHPVEEILGHTDAELVPEATARRFREADAAVIAAGQRQTQEETGLMGGQLRSWHANKAPLRDTAGQIIGIIGVSREITEHKLAEAALRASEAQYRELFTTAHDLIFTVSPAGEILLANPAFEQVLGYSGAEVARLTIRDLLHPDSMTACQAHFAEVTSGQDAGWVEAGFRTKAGGVVWVEGSCTCRFQAGRPHFIQGIFRDITERKLAAAARREAEVRFRTLFDRAPVGVVVIDPATARVLECNEVAARQLGYTVAEFMRLGIADFEAVETPAQTQTHLDQILRTGRDTFETRHRTRTGELREVFVTTQVIELAGRRVSHCIFLDITERKQAEAALRESEAALHRAQAVAHVGSWRLDIPRNILTWSAEAHRIFGIPAGTPLTYETFLTCVHPDDRAMVDRAWQAAVGGAPYDVEHRIVIGGTLKWVREQAWLEFDAAGRIASGVGTTQDITERKQAEQRLAAFAALGRRLNAIEELKEAARVLTAVADELFGWDACFVELYEADQRVRPVLTMDLVDGRKVEIPVVPTDRPTPAATGPLIETGELILREPLAPAAGERFVPFGDTARRSASLLFVPLRSHGRTIGLCSIQSYTPHAYTPASLETLQALADYAALTLERLLAQEALRASEARYRLLFTGNPHPMWVFDRDTLAFLEVNEAALALYGHTRAGFLALKTPDLRPPEERQRLVQTVALESPGVQNQGIWRHWKKDGTRMAVEVFAHGLEFAGRRAELVLVQDVTAQLTAEAEVVQLSGRLLRAQDDERRRLAREIHDSTAQIFAALAMNLAVLGRTASGLDAAGRALLAECEAQVKRGTAELRTFAYLLHPPALEVLGLVRAIQDYAEGFAQRSGIRVELALPPVLERLSADIELTLFRVVQESLGNLHRHSGSPTAAIRLARDEATVTLEVRDAGRGLGEVTLAAAHSGSARFGVGIAGMRERLRLLGGRLELEPALPGLRVRATLPLVAATNEFTP